MNIIKKPDPLSFVGNLNDFALSGIASSVSFSLSSSEGEIINEIYFPDNSGKVLISVRDIVKELLSIEIPSLSEQSYIQTKSVKQFTAKINTSTHIFTVIKGGVANLSESTSQFLKLNFLTWQPQTKEILQRSIEFLSYYTQEECSLKIKAYFSDNSTSIKSISLTTNKHYTLNLSYSIVSSYFSKKVCYYDAYIEGGTRFTYVQRYMLTNEGEYAQLYLFENSLASIDSLLCTGSIEKKPKSESSLARCFDETVIVDTSLLVEYSQNTGFIDSKSVADWISELFHSPQILHYTDVLKKVYIRENDNTFIEDTLNNFSFSFYACLDEIYQKQDRDREAIPPYLDYSNELFFLETRLAELNTISLSSEVFIPGQLLGSNSWGKVSIDSLITEAFSRFEIPTFGLDEIELHHFLTKEKYATQEWVSKQGYGSSESNADLSKLWKKDEIPNLDKLRIDADGNLYVPGNVCAFADSDYLSKIVDSLPIASTSSKGIAQFSDSQFTVVNGIVSINENYIGGGLDESALASWLSSHSYATESWVNSKGYLRSHQSLNHLAKKQIGDSWKNGIIGNYTGFNSSAADSPSPGNTFFGFFSRLVGNEKYSGALAMRANSLYFRTKENDILGDWKKIYHTGNKPSYLDVGASAAIHKHSEYIEKKCVGVISIESLDGTWHQKISTIDTSAKSAHRFMFSERQGSGGYRELFGVDGYGDIYADNYKVATQAWIKSQLSNYLTKIKASHFVVGYDWGAKANGFHCGVDGIYGGISFYDGKKDHSASIFRDADTNLYVGARSGIKDKGITIDINGNVVGSGNVTAFSDMRLKSFKKPLKSVLNNIDNLSTFYYYWKDKAKYDSNLHLGLSAQEVDILFPEFVNHGDILSLDYGKLGAVVAIKGLQEVNSWMYTSDKRILELEKQVSKLKNQLKYVA